MRPLSVYRKVTPAAGAPIAETASTTVPVPLGAETVEYIGATMPILGEPTVLYVVQPGPLLKAYRLACEHPDESVVLIIEEISRAVASYVFGDIFQLLDRLEEDAGDGTPAGFSRYDIEPRADISAWLSSNNVEHDYVTPGRMRLPDNLYIWATMNRSDQNAKQIDAAFARRWKKESLTYTEECTYGETTLRYGGVSVTWDALRTAVNNKLVSLDAIPEDKFVGPYLLSKSDLANPDVVLEDLWGYLWTDVLKATRAPEFFGTRTFAELKKAWNDGNGSPIGPIER